MRRIATVALVAIVLLAGAAAVAWINRISLAEWAIAMYQPETPLGPVTVRISDITFSSVTVSEIRARFRGPISIQDASAEFAFGEDWHLSVPSVRIGSLNAALSFADWADLLDTLGSGHSGGDVSAMPKWPVTIGDVTVETIDLYAETPKGYALLNGNLAFLGKADLSQTTALPALAGGLEGNLLLSAGAAAFPIERGAMGGGSLVLSAAFAKNVAQIEAVTPIRIDVDISEPLPDLPSVPAGRYRADIGSDATPFQMTLGYSVDPAATLRTVNFSPFPFALDTPFGTAEAQATTAPIALTDGATDPATLPIGMKGSLNLTAVPLPGSIKTDIAGDFEIDKGETIAIKFGKNFWAAADLSASTLLADLPPAIRDILSNTLALSAKSKISVELSTDNGGNRITGTGSIAMESGGLSASLPSGLSLFMGPNGGIETAVEKIALRLDSSKGPSPVEGTISVSLDAVSLALAEDGGLSGRGDYVVEADAGLSQGSVDVVKSGGVTTARITDGSVKVGASALTVPAFGATMKISENGIDLSATVAEVLLGDLRALKRPLVLTAEVTSNGDFNASGAVDTVLALHADGSYVDGDVVMAFGSGDIPLGPTGLDLSELTDLVDLGRSDPNGSIRIDGELTYQHDAISGYADLQIAEIGSVLADGTKISVLGTVTFDLSRLPATMNPATLTGVLSSDFFGTIPFEETFTVNKRGQMEIQSLEAQVLGGSVTIREGLANPAAGSLSGRLHTAAIDLKALAKLLSIEGLDGTGRLTGDLDFRVTGETVVIERGELKAEKPGLLRYRGEALRAAATGNENLALLVQALENFQYEVLTLGIDIPEFGEGLVTLHLEGNNPDVLEGHPFDVTINLESEYGRLIKVFLNLYNEMDNILQGVVR